MDLSAAWLIGDPDKISRIELEIGVVGGHIALNPMGLESGGPPHHKLMRYIRH
jgi:hypothetical protein